MNRLAIPLLPRLRHAELLPRLAYFLGDLDRPAIRLQFSSTASGQRGEIDPRLGIALIDVHYPPAQLQRHLRVAPPTPWPRGFGGSFERFERLPCLDRTPLLVRQADVEPRARAQVMRTVLR